MEWTYLGHAMWLVVAEGLRFVCDPIVQRTHHGGVFNVIPPRLVKPETLKPDFILVSHRHGDHFDVPSLHAFATLDPDTVVITPDELVAWACRELGFRTVRCVPSGQHIQLDRVILITTPSVLKNEWGLVIASEKGTVWNQVDTVFDDVHHASHVASNALRAVSKTHFDLVLVSWNPMLEIAAQIGDSTRFPYESYHQHLEEIAAVPTAAVIPAASGVAHVAACDWMNHWVYPVSEERFVKDLMSRCPRLDVKAANLGSCFKIRRDEPLAQTDCRTHHITLLEPESMDPRQWAPVVMPPIADSNSLGHPIETIMARIEPWLHNELAPALRTARNDWGTTSSVKLLLELVFAAHNEHFTFTVDAESVRVTRGAVKDWDVFNAIAASALLDVLDGRLQWGDVLLAGNLRARMRAYNVNTYGLRATPIAEIFLYYGLSYAASEEHATRRAVAAVLMQ